MNREDVELFLCRKSLNGSLWFKEVDLPKEVLAQYVCYKKSFVDRPNKCNTDKSVVYSCVMKCKTRGILLAASNCGIILFFRELCGSESLTQDLDLDLYENFVGN